MENLVNAIAARIQEVATNSAAAERQGYASRRSP